MEKPMLKINPKQILNMSTIGVIILVLCIIFSIIGFWIGHAILPAACIGFWWGALKIAIGYSICAAICAIILIVLVYKEQNW